MKIKIQSLTKGEFATPLILLDSPTTINWASPASTALFAGQHLHWTSQTDLHLTAAHTLAGVAGGATTLFTHGGGIQAIAANGPVSLQAHTDQLDILADDSVTVTSVNGDIEVKANRKIVLQADGASITLEGPDITLACSGGTSVKGAVHGFEGAMRGEAGLEGLPSGSVATPAPVGVSGIGAAAPAASAGTPVKTGLGDDVDKLAAKSPSLQKDWQQLKDKKWKIEYGEAGGGSFANRNSRPPKIIIDGALKNNSIAATQTLAHEVGHATYSYKEDYSSKSAYVNGALADEGAATLNNIKVQREIIANGGPDIGIAGNSTNHAAYNKAYDQFLKDGNAATAQQSIGAQFGMGEITSNTGQPYADYYGGWYDQTFPPKKK